jgi:hypothetical protein
LRHPHAAAQQQADTQAMQQQLAYQQAQIEQMQAQQVAPQSAAQPPAAAAPAPAATDLTTKLNQLAQLHASGVLSDEEFSAAKQKVLAGG